MINWKYLFVAGAALAGLYALVTEAARVRYWRIRELEIAANTKSYPC